MNEIPNLTAALALAGFAWFLAGLVWLVDWTRAERIRRALHIKKERDA